MAYSIARSNNYHHNVSYVLGLFSVLLLLQKGNGLQFSVGGASGWTVPKNGSAFDYNQWAERTRFQIGDSLLFTYDPSQDSVLEVKKEDYNNCTTTAPLATYSDGHTVYTFNHSGNFYFISGKKENCQENEKLIIAVLADRSNKTSSSTIGTTTSSPPPSGDIGTVPSPAPYGEESPPAVTVENPTQSPTEGPPSAASSIFLSFSASSGAFLASYLILVS